MEAMDFIKKLDNVKTVTYDIAFMSIDRRNQMVSYSSGDRARQFRYPICVLFDQQLLETNASNRLRIVHRVYWANNFQQDMNM